MDIAVQSIPTGWQLTNKGRVLRTYEPGHFFEAMRDHNRLVNLQNALDADSADDGLEIHVIRTSNWQWCVERAKLALQEEIQRRNYLGYFMALADFPSDEEIEASARKIAETEGLAI